MNVAIRFSEFTSIAYSRRGRTMALNRGVMALSESLENGWRAIISIRLALFAASLQCTEDMNAVPMGILRLYIS